MSNYSSFSNQSLLIKNNRPALLACEKLEQITRISELQNIPKEKLAIMVLFFLHSQSKKSQLEEQQIFVRYNKITLLLECVFPNWCVLIFC